MKSTRLGYEFCKILVILSILIIVVQTIGCASNPKVSEAPAVSLAQSLGSAECGQGELRGFGMGANENEALNAARSSLAMQIHSSIKVSSKYRISQQVLNGEETLSSDYESVSAAEAILLNAHEARTQRVERREHEAGIVLCMSRADAAKGFAERQRLVADSMDFAANASLGAEFPKAKREAFQRTQKLWNEFVKLQGSLESFGADKADYFSSKNEIYSKAREDYKDYCSRQKMHWNPERQSSFSDMAFSKLSMPSAKKSDCEDGEGSKDILLTYKDAEPECSYDTNKPIPIYACSYRASLSIALCSGGGVLLDGPVKPGMHGSSESYARENLRRNFESADFWEKWKQELKEWSVQCE